ncbi:MAG: PHP domain-containing protein [Bacilli bacterium]|nr:PHP domain-containing protein [Bacilli bacterium]
MIRKIDLHIHTTYSDGVLSPKQVIDKAVENKVEVIAIADHDTVDAYNEELYAYAEKKNIKLINAVEVSTKTEKSGIHVLGYNFDMNNQEFREKLFSIRNARHDYLYKVADKLKKIGYVLHIESLDKIESVTKAHIALDIIENEENRELLVREFGYIPSKGEFIEMVMNEGCKAYAEKQTVTPKQAADMIRKAGGKVVLAHPVAYFYEDNLQEEDILDIVKDMKPDGIEAYYLYVDRHDQKINDSKKWCTFADKYNLFKTIGSDYHGSDGLRPEIGFDDKELVLSENEIEKLMLNLISK